MELLETKVMLSHPWWNLTTRSSHQPTIGLTVENFGLVQMVSPGQLQHLQDSETRKMNPLKLCKFSTENFMQEHGTGMAPRYGFLLTVLHGHLWQ